MKRISKWLKNKFSRHSSGVDADEHHTAVGVTTKENIEQENGDGDDTPTIPTLTILEDSSFEVTESTGFDPYDSGSFEWSKSRSRK